MTIRVREIAAPQDSIWEAAMALYETSFPLAEREPRATVERELVDGLTRFWVAHDESHALLGFVRAAWLPSASASVVIHIAVAEAARGSGVGEALLRTSREGYGIENPTLFEVERLREAESDSERRTRQRRLDWFRNRGCRQVTGSYVQPSLHPETPAVPMHLLVLGPDRDRGTLISGIYHDFWHLDPDNDLVIHALSDSDPEPF